MRDQERFNRILNLQRYARINNPLRVDSITTKPTHESQMILRMLVEAPYSRGLQLPDELRWTNSLIEQAKRFQREVIGISHPFIYVTVRHGRAGTVADDEWHVDGFSMRYNHLPEANYLFATGKHTTEYVRQAFLFPSDFDPIRHNVHRFFQRRIHDGAICQIEPDVLYFMDPYVIHRRPPSSNGTMRTLGRISFTPIEIPDINNTPNPHIETQHYCIDGVKEFRDLLQDYDVE